MPKKSLEERKVNSKSSQLKALGGKKEGLETAASSNRGHVVQKKTKGGGGEVGQRVEGGEKSIQPRTPREIHEIHVKMSRFLITFFDHVF